MPIEYTVHAMHYTVSFTLISEVDAVRGSHVTTDVDRFWGVDANVGGFGNVLVTGRQTQANIFQRGFQTMCNGWKYSMFSGEWMGFPDWLVDHSLREPLFKLHYIDYTI